MNEWITIVGDWVDKWIFRILMLVLVAAMLFNAYVNFVNKEFQEETTEHLAEMEAVIQDIPTNQELKQQQERLLKVTDRIAERLGIPDDD